MNQQTATSATLSIENENNQQPERNLYSWEQKWCVEIMEDAANTGITFSQAQDMAKGYNNKVAETIRKYMELSGSNPIECLPHYVFGLFNHSSSHETKVRHMQQVVFSLLKFFSNPAISSQYENGNKKELDKLMNVLERLNEFCDDMKEPYNDFAALMDMADVECNYGRESFSNLSYIEDQYKRKIRIEEAKIALQEQE